MQFWSRFALVLSAGWLFTACATTAVQQGRDYQNSALESVPSSEAMHQLIVVGDAGNATEPDTQRLLQDVKNRAVETNIPTAILFAGDNIYPKGLVGPKKAGRSAAEASLQAQIDLGKSAKVPTYFIPGNHDWYSGLDGLMEQKDRVAAELGKKAFLPRKYSPIEDLELNGELVLLAIDSEWFLQDWNQHADINEASTIRTREDFFEEFRSLLNKYQKHTVYVAIHHPLLDNGSHGGYFGWENHLEPVHGVVAPVVGSIVAYLRKFSGASPADFQFRPYQALRQRLTTLAQEYPNIVFVSGHDHNLQYIAADGIRQVISGAGSKVEPARARQPESVSIGQKGYAVLSWFADHRVGLQFYTIGQTQPVWERVIVPAKSQPDLAFPAELPATQTASIYPESATQKSGLYRWLFGEHYRQLYSQPIEVPVAHLDTLKGGLRPLISGGGMQSESLRFTDVEGKQWVMRALKKSPARFIQAGLLKNVYVKNQVEDTFMTSFIADFYTATHPYMAFSLRHLSEAAGLYHTLPSLYYLPKQAGLQGYNAKYGDALYMLEDRPHKSQADRANFGQGTDLIGTMDLLAQLEKDEKYKVDTDLYIRARLFDMLIGDWDRHQDQWRWVEKQAGDFIVYQPIPRDRDQAFAQLDGVLLRRLIALPALRHMQPYKSEFARPRWINKTAFPLDRHLLQNTQWEQWEQQAAFLQSAITDETIEKVFESLPEGVRAYRRAEITQILKDRRAGLATYAQRYYSKLFAVRQVTGTNKKDVFVLKTDPNGVEVSHLRNKKTGLQAMSTHYYLAKETREIWLYALDDDDSIRVEGARTPIKIRIIGGKNHDTYLVDSPAKVRIYDYQSKTNTIEKGSSTRLILKDNYALNQFDFRQAPLNVLTVVPDAGYNPDNGVMLGLHATYTHQNFLRNPYAHQHHLRAKVDFAYSGFMASYSGTFKNYSRNWFWGLDLGATNSNYSQNYFGWGNLSENRESQYTMDFHRVRTSQYEIAPSYQYEGRNGSKFKLSAHWQQLHIEPTGDRLWDQLEAPTAYATENFVSGQVAYRFANFNDSALPSLGMRFDLDYGFRAKTANWEAQHQWVSARLDWVFPLAQAETLTWWHRLYGKQIWGSEFAFYQAADLGAKQLLRGYRQNRFLGEAAAAYSTDVRWSVGSISQKLVPMKWGMYAGYDVGRVWMRGEDSNKWHQDAGGGFWLTFLESATVNAAAFKGSERWLFSFGFGYQF